MVNDKIAKFKNQFLKNSNKPSSVLMPRPGIPVYKQSIISENSVEEVPTPSREQFERYAEVK